MKYIYIIFSILLFNSCIGLKDLNYLQPNSNLELNEYGLVTPNIEKYRVQIDDILSLSLQTLDPDALKFLVGNMAVSGITANNGSYLGGVASSLLLSGYRVDKDGKINILGLGDFQVQGKTLDDIQKILMDNIRTSIYKDNITQIRVSLNGVTFTTIGEFTAPGKKTIDKVNANLLDAIAASGDLQKLADRKNIILIRQYPEGTKRVNIDITREDIQNSPYFWVQPNDFIIANPRKEKVTGLGGGTYLNDVLLGVSLLTQSITLFLFFNRL